jgi:hypothetical protein
MPKRSRAIRSASAGTIRSRSIRSVSAGAALSGFSSGLT